MKDRQIRKSTRFAYEVTPQIVFTNWMKAVCLLHQNHVQLTNYLTDPKIQHQPSVDSTLQIGQCPYNELLALVNLFEVELTKLLQDVNESAEWDQLAPCKNYDVLIDHTLRLNQLNNQAQTRIYLMSLPAS